jgi:hypothetical protein
VAPVPLLSHSGHDCFYLQFSKVQEKAGVKRKYLPTSLGSKILWKFKGEGWQANLGIDIKFHIS